MECGKLTAKLRDAVPVCFMVDGKEVKRFKNIEIPDEIKRLPFIDFRFDVPQNGAITFKIMFEAGVLPEIWPEARQRKQRGSMTAGQSLNSEPETAAMGTQMDTDVLENPSRPVPERIVYNVTGDRRKALVAEISNYTGEKAVYQNAPTFAYRIGAYTVDKSGTLSGPIDYNLIRWLANEGFLINK